MKKLLFIPAILFLVPGYTQIICNPAGNVVLFSNYDGGVLNINVDVNIPNLKIGVVSYEPVTINVGGTFVNNITEIRFAGYTPSGNMHCNNSPVVTSITGAPAGTDTLVYTPSSPVPNPNGYSIIICNYSCDTVNSQGGCNTPDQVAGYFLQVFGGALRSHLTQYGCWSGSALVSNGGNCCVGAVSTPPMPVCAFQSSDTAFCEKQCIDFTDLTTNIPNSWQWYFPGASPDTSSQQNPVNICYNAYGSYDVALVACNAAGCDSVFFPAVIEVYQPAPVPLISWQNDTLFCTQALQYAWYNAANPTVVLSTDSFLNVAGLPDDYFVIITDSNGCQTSSLIFTVTGLTMLNNDMPYVKINPNPASGFIRVIFNDQYASGNIRYSLSDITGRIIRSATVEIQTGTSSIRLGCPGFPDGLYLLEISRDNRLYRQKLVIQQ